MEPKFQTSFIPKNPIGISSTPTSISRYKSVSILPTIGTILFVLSILISGGLFGYERLLNSKIDEDDKELSLTKEAFDPSAMDQLITASNQIKSAKDLLNKHIAVSNIFTLLQANILPEIQFTSFDFSNEAKGNIKISAEGVAASYSVLAEQDEIFSKINYMSNQSFSSFDLTDKGTVNIKFQADINPNILSYKQVLETSSAGNFSTATSSGN